MYVTEAEVAHDATGGGGLPVRPKRGSCAKKEATPLGAPQDVPFLQSYWHAPDELLKSALVLWFHSFWGMVTLA
jgi:hypothetical protein